MTADSQAAIKAVEQKAKTGRTTSEDGRAIGRCIARLRRKGREMKLVWIKAHIGMVGNELAD